MRKSVWIETLPDGYSVRFYDAENKKQREWCPDYATAQRRKAQIKLELLNKAGGCGNPTAKPSDVLEEYLRSCSLQRPNTLDMKRRALSAILSSLERMDQLTTTRIRQWRDTSMARYSPDTVSINLRCLRAFCRWCVREGILRDSPFHDISIPAGREVGRRLEIDEINRILEALDPKAKPFFLFAIHTGARRGEILLSKWEDFDLDAGTWRIPKAEGRKGRYVRVIPLEKILVDYLKTATRHGSGPFSDFNRFTPRWYLKQALKKAGITGRVRTHDFRHSVASWYMIQGGDPLTLQKLMGWQSYAMAAKYSHLNVKAFSDALHRFGIGSKLSEGESKSDA